MLSRLMNASYWDETAVWHFKMSEMLLAGPGLNLTGAASR